MRHANKANNYLSNTTTFFLNKKGEIQNRKKKTNHVILKMSLT